MWCWELLSNYKCRSELLHQRPCGLQSQNIYSLALYIKFAECCNAVRWAQFNSPQRKGWETKEYLHRAENSQAACWWSSGESVRNNSKSRRLTGKRLEWESMKLFRGWPGNVGEGVEEQRYGGRCSWGERKSRSQQALSRPCWILLSVMRFIEEL